MLKEAYGSIEICEQEHLAKQNHVSLLSESTEASTQ